MSTKKWDVSAVDKDKVKELVEKYDYPTFLALILVIRGLTEISDIETFLNGKDFCDPWCFVDMDKAVERIERAIECGERIAIYGDYDADGVTATVLLHTYLEMRGASVIYYIPQRSEDGYGMSREGIDKLAGQGTTLIITVDNGISAGPEIEYASSLGIDTVVTDHHAVPETLPPAVAVVDPHRADCPSPFKEYCGAGVAFKLVCALEREECNPQMMMDFFADLVTIGTVGDIVSLTGENRALVRYGLPLLTESGRVGIQALLRYAGILGQELTAGDVSYRIVPRINAMGRMSAADQAVSLFLSDNEEEADEIAQAMQDANRSRQEMEQTIVEEVVAMLRERADLRRQRVLVLWGEGWHSGVLGIVAARITERYGKPCVILTSDGVMAKGSARSLTGFSIHKALVACEDLLEKYGGHTLAAGMTLKAENLELLRERINRYALEQGDMPLPTLKVDCRLNPVQLQLDVVSDLNYLEPFGAGNPSPVFGLYRMRLERITPIGGGKHLRLGFERGGNHVQALAFGVTPEDFPYPVGEELDLAVTLGRSEYRGQASLSVYIKEMKPSDFDNGVALSEKADWEKLLRGEFLTPDTRQRMIPSREENAAVYRLLKSEPRRQWNLFHLCYRLQKAVEGHFGWDKMMVALACMQEKKLISLRLDGEQMTIELLPVSGKVDLEDTKWMRRLRQEPTRRE